MLTPMLLLKEFPERLETANGFEPCLNWSEYILARIETAYPNSTRTSVMTSLKKFARSFASDV